MRFLIVDDELFAREDLKTVLQKVDSHAHIDEADCYQGAIEICQNNKIDVAFLDVELPGKNGIVLAKALKDICPRLNVIMVTAYASYAMDAFALYVSGYLLKPVLDEDLITALEHLRYPVSREEHKEKQELYVQCFGNFEVFYQGNPLMFKRSKAKEVLAYLICLRGATASAAEITAVLWDDEYSTKDYQSYFRQAVAELRRVLKECHYEHILIHSRNAYAVNINAIECDWYDFLHNGSEPYFQKYGSQIEFMSQYSWAEMYHFNLSHQ